MAKGPRYRVPFRRRREGKTDYRARKALILSKLPRAVTRGSLKHMNVQIIEAKVQGDQVVAHAHSQELTKLYGWKAGCGNVPAAYLTGLLCGLRAVAKGVKEAVLDIGLHLPSKGARVFAALKGLLDAGVELPHSEKKLPDQARIEGKHIAEYAKQLASNPDEYKQRFSNYLERKLPPEKLPEHFSEIREKILASFKEEKVKKAKKVRKTVKKTRKTRKNVKKRVSES